MVYWSPHLLMDAELSGKEKLIAHDIRQGKRQKEIYCILLPQNPANLFEIMHINELNFPYYQKRDIYLVGLAKSRKKAIMLVCGMIAEAYRKSDQPDIHSWFSDCCKWRTEPVHTVVSADR